MIEFKSSKNAFFIALGMALCGFFVGFYYYHAQMDNRTVSVKGLAEMNVKADLAVWTIKFKTTGNNLQETQNKLENDRSSIISFLNEKGFDASEIMESVIITNDLMTNPYRDSDRISSRYILSQTINVRTQKVDEVASALKDLTALVAKGIVFDNPEYGSPVSYLFTKLNDVKPQMLEKATQNAKQAADEFAKSSNSRLGKITTANQGAFSILPREETPNATESEQLFKKIRVVATVQYFLD